MHRRKSSIKTKLPTSLWWLATEPAFDNETNGISTMNNANAAADAPKNVVRPVRRSQVVAAMCSGNRAMSDVSAVAAQTVIEVAAAFPI